MSLLQKPFSEMTRDEVMLAIELWDMRNSSVRFMNESYVAPERPTRLYVHSDYMGSDIHGLQSMADGKKYDSKSAYYKSLKAHGCEIVGNEKQGSGHVEQYTDSQATYERELKTTIEKLQSQ